MTLALICLPSESVCRKKRVTNEELAKQLDALKCTNEWQFEKVLEAIEKLPATRVSTRTKTRKKRKARFKTTQDHDCDT